MSKSLSKTRWRPLFVGVGGFTVVMSLVLALWWSGCFTPTIRPPANKQPQVMAMEITAYCNCGACCGWERKWFGLGPPVISSGAQKGQPKKVGLTASGVYARHGTVAADTTKLPFGTIVYVPGYGYGSVEDRGGAIKGQRLDLWFPSHERALRWGRQKLQVKVWLP